MRWLFRKSKWLHKFLGLLLIVYGALMGASGILVNHPSWIRALSVPRWLTPEQYQLRDWNRGALVELVFAPDDPETAYAAGSEGVWKTRDGGRTFLPLDLGFPSSAVDRQTNALLLTERPAERLFAGTEAGMFVYDSMARRWSPVPLGDTSHPVRTLLAVDERILVFTDSHVYECPPEAPSEPRCRLVPARRVPRGGETKRASLVLFFFDLHSGALLGLPGQLLFDVVGMIIVLLSFSAFYLWYYPRKRRRERARSGRAKRSATAQGFFRFLFNYHLKIGIWVSPILLLMAGTGLFMRPPMLIALAQGAIPAAWYPGLPPADSWEERIHRATFDPVRERILIEATDGFWSGPADFSAPFEPVELPIPIHVMGSSLLMPYGDGEILAGSFSGVFHLEPDNERITDLMTGQEAGEVSTMRLAEHMVTGYFKTPAEEEFVTTFRGGLVPLGDAEPAGRFKMPSAMQDRYRMPLWNYMFELHNARFFRDWIGQWYLLIPPLGSLLFLMLTVTGGYDWLYLRLLQRRSGRSDDV
ncbi:MAG: PepSY domain-containing protein [bacterium]|nr:PepSY domain-containing protein [bacterium]